MSLLAFEVTRSNPSPVKETESTGMDRKLLEVLGEGSSGMKGAYVAGGAITSLVTNKPINDFDIYPKSNEARDEIIHWLYESGYYNSFVSSRALSFSHGETTIQVMLFDTYETPQKIFDFFDFTVCMGAYDLDTNKFAFHKDFLIHNSQRFISFNPDTKYPYASAWRIEKYKERGYTIGKMEYFKILMACQRIPINSWDDLREQVGGVYGEAMTFPEDEEFSFEGALKVISTMRPSKTCTTGYPDVNTAIAMTSSREFEYIDMRDQDENVIITYGNRYLVKFDEELGFESCGHIPKNGKKVGMDKVFPEPVFYKKIKLSKNGQYHSVHHPNFKYTINGWNSAKSPYIYCYKTLDEAKKHGYPSSEDVLVRLTCKHEDIVWGGGKEINLKQAFVEIVKED